jgi:integrase
MEVLRLDWADVFKIPGHIEINSTKSKTRSRRLCEMGDSLRQWLEPYRQRSGPVFAGHRDTYHASLTSLLASLGIPTKKNGLRHGFCTFHFAAFGNENLTAQQAGNSPSVIHRHYRGLATKTEAEKWFAVAPAERDKVVPLCALSGKPAH